MQLPRRLTALLDRLDARTDRLIARLRADRRWGYQFLGLAIATVFALNFTLYATCGLRGCPDPARLVAYQPGGASVLLDRNGRKFSDLAPVQRETVKLSALPDHVSSAFVAIEDKRFFDHEGVDWIRVFGAAFRNILSGEIDQGSSTITMQLSRNVFPDRLRASDKSLRRKLFEARVAKKIEKRFTKQEILELYLNHIYFGGGAYGIQSAARYYFEKPASKLKLHEAAMLAALPKAPAHYDPRNKPQRARQRRDLVLTVMAQEGFIEPARADAASELRLGVTRDAPGFHGQRPLGAYFTQIVRNELEERFGEEIYTRKLRVYTTLDITAQKAAEEELNRQLRVLERGAFGSVRGATFAAYDSWRPEGPQYVQGAVVVMEAATGDIMALVGGRDFRHSRFNRATLAKRQSGSAFKPFVYGAALAEGYAPSQPILDAPVRLVSDGKAWEPRNYDNDHYGLLSMRSALAYSRNIPSVRLAAAVGHDDVATVASAAGIKGEIKATPMIALGITEVTPLELTAAYATFANLGTRVQPRYVLAVEDENGKVLYSSQLARRRTLDAGLSYVLTDMMSDVVNQGTGSAARQGYHGPLAGKTGTTSDGADVWFVGYTPEIVAGVWVGFDERRKLPARASGGNVSAPVFGRVLSRIYRNRETPAGWSAPANVVTRLVDPETGLVLDDGCYPMYGNPLHEVFLEEFEPETTCPRRADYNIFEALGDWLDDVFSGENEYPEPEPGVSADGTRDVLGSEKLRHKETRPRERRASR
ncbi:MAG TPA: PBP1A family penicillin-binding protein [Longimicrobiales bacterium]|nr:PBP1A family penicillin-binding protein [Longimicrobiales bacterium]